ncbi:MAG: DNA polymerase III subunit gamma/tau, partial [Candidatus Bathyanammoxibius sp.]
MTYTVFARKYRPQGFDEVVGQDAIVTTLKNALKQGRVAHAYLFTGPRGVGKTSLARILAKALNCQKGPTEKPCNKCDICQSISEGRDMDVLEIDGASNRGIDEVRTIRGNVKYLPSRSRYKIYIIDEVHMLTREAFNALLKTLEEPPSHVKFFFATTAPGKLPETVQSRCQRFDLRNVLTADIVKRLKQIAGKEGLEIEEEAVKAIARYSKGGLRDAQSLLDQMGSYSEGKITLADVQGLLGTVGEEEVEALVNSLIGKDAPAALKVVHGIMNEGRDLDVFVDQLVWYLRDLFVVSTCGHNVELLENPWRERELLERQAKELTGDTIVYMIQALTDMKRKAVDDLQERIFLEMTVVKLAGMENLEPIENILHRLEELEKKVCRGAAGAGSAASAESTGRSDKFQTGDPTGHSVAETKGSYVKSGDRKQAVATPDVAEGAAKGATKAGRSQDVGDVKEVWKKLLNHVQGARHNLWKSLKGCMLTGLGDEEAVITFPKARQFSMQSLGNKAEEIRLIEDCLGDITGKKLRLKLILSEGSVVTHESEAAPDTSDDESPCESNVNK